MDKVRVVGGAYGASIGFNKWTGQCTFSSYRDPNLVKTLQNFDGTAGYLRELQLSKEELTKAIIGTIGSLDTPMSAQQKGRVAMIRHMSGIKDEDRQKWRDQVLSTTNKDFNEFAERLQLVAERGSVAVVGSNSAFEEAKANLGDDFKLTTVL